MKIIRKVTKNGNCATVAIHPAQLDFIGIGLGDSVVVEVRSSKELVIRPVETADLRAPMPRTRTLDHSDAVTK